jgi:hypothetical protein
MPGNAPTTSTSRPSALDDTPVTNIGGTNRTSTSTSTTTQNTPAWPSNTQACHNYAELRDQKHSSTTEVCAHNPPFVHPNNAARNQAYSVTQQLNDSISVLSGQAHIVNDILYDYYTFYNLLNAGIIRMLPLGSHHLGRSPSLRHRYDHLGHLRSGTERLERRLGRYFCRF